MELDANWEVSVRTEMLEHPNGVQKIQELVVVGKYHITGHTAGCYITPA